MEDRFIFVYVKCSIREGIFASWNIVWKMEMGIVFAPWVLFDSVAVKFVNISVIFFFFTKAAKHAM